MVGVAEEDADTQERGQSFVSGKQNVVVRSHTFYLGVARLDSQERLLHGRNRHRHNFLKKSHPGLAIYDYEQDTSPHLP